MEEHNYTYLKGLVDSDFQVVDGQPNIIGWQTKNENGTYIGLVKDLLFDIQTNSVRYLIIDLSNSGMTLDDKRVMIPIGMAHLHLSDDEVVLPNVHQDQFNALPSYCGEDVGPDTEVKVRKVIGSPAALRIEEKIVEFDREQFYAHQHFDRDHFYQRGGDPARRQEERTIHDLIQNTKGHDVELGNSKAGDASRNDK